MHRRDRVAALLALAALTLVGVTSASCAAPGAPGCATCCVRAATQCITRSSTQSTAAYAWYNVQNYTRLPCPAACPACATCSERDAALATQIVPRAQQCRCGSLSRALAGADPCFEPGSCACACVMMNHLSTCTR